jgi:GNAT superfamily N-acetyltransferase
MIERACFVAKQDKDVVGAIFITLLPDSDPCDWDSYHWPETPPADCITRCLGRPHLTWIFVAPLSAGHGVGTALLAAAARELLALGYTQLLSTFMMGNDSSMLWHWRNGFQLLAYPGSYRLMQERWQKMRQA